MTYGAPYDNIIIGGESDGQKEAQEKQKVRNRFNDLASRSDNGLAYRINLNDYIQATRIVERGKSPSLIKNITQEPIGVNMLWKLGIFFIAIGLVKLVIYGVMKVRDRNASR